MANDLDEAEAVLRDHDGVDNNEIGRVLSRLARAARAIVRRLGDIETRLTALEQRAPTSSHSTPVTDEPAPTE